MIRTKELFQKDSSFIWKANGSRSCHRLPFALIFFLVLLFRTSTLARAARTAAGFAVWAADALLPAFLCLEDITDGRADDQSNHKNQNDINGSHADAPFPYAYAFRAYSALTCLFLLIITAAKMTAMVRTIAQPRIGIQAAPKLPPVISVPKKNTRKPMVYPTEN